jgi:hypothetical protein
MALSFLDSPSSPPTPFADQLPPLDRHYFPNANMEWDQDMLDELLDSSLDLDEFLATVVVQAPMQSGICELTPEEVSAFIIPPPPPPSTYNVLVSSDFFSLGIHLLTLGVGDFCDYFRPASTFSVQGTTTSTTLRGAAWFTETE